MRCEVSPFESIYRRKAQKLRIFHKYLFGQALAQFLDQQWEMWTRTRAALGLLLKPNFQSLSNQ